MKTRTQWSPNLEWTGEQVIPELMCGDARELQAHMSRYVFALRWCSEQATRPDVPPTKRVLDAACGCGFGTYILSSVAKEAFGVDLSLNCVNYARAVYSTPRTFYFTGDVTRLDAILSAGDFFDTCVSFETVEHLKEPEAFLQGVYRLLVPGGHLAISAPHGSSSCFHVPREGQPHGNYTRAQLWELVAKVFPRKGMEYWCQDERTNFYREEQTACPIRTHIVVACKEGGASSEG